MKGISVTGLLAMPVMGLGAQAGARQPTTCSTTSRGQAVGRVDCLVDRDASGRVGTIQWQDESVGLGGWSRINTRLCSASKARSWVIGAD